MLCLEYVKDLIKLELFSCMDDSQVIEFIKSDMIWHKPTQSF